VVAQVIEKELRAEILAHLDDDAPRRIYADWLIERGDLRGELIQLDLDVPRLSGAERAAFAETVEELRLDASDAEIAAIATRCPARLKRVALEKLRASDFLSELRRRVEVIAVPGPARSPVYLEFASDGQVDAAILEKINRRVAPSPGGYMPPPTMVTGAGPTRPSRMIVLFAALALLAVAAIAIFLKVRR
jgi:uncharacterized protein (TIGR02996 family)